MRAASVAGKYSPPGWGAIRRDEYNPIRPDSAAAARFALIYPNTYHIGMSNVGLHYVYQALNAIPGAACERFFTDHPRALSVDSDAPLNCFPVLLFSMAYEMDYINVVCFLRQNGVPLRAEERDDSHPLIFGGGVLASLNRLPAYDFFDGFLLGDGEALVAPLVARVLEHGANRRKLLGELSGLPGVEITAGARKRRGMETDFDARSGERDAFGVPFQPPRPRDAHAHELGRAVCNTQILTPHTEFASRHLIEISRGCPYVCTFCYVGHNFAPYQPRPLDLIFEQIVRWRKHTDKVGIVASAVGSHPEIDRICEFCDELDAEVSFSSLRVEDITPGMLNSLLRGGQQSLTIAPEAGSEQLRKLLGKRLSDARIYEFCEEALRRGVRDLKLYFMLGLPREQPEDILAIETMVLRLREMMLAIQRPSGQLGRIALNAGIFVPKPNIPLSRLDPPEPQTVKKHIELLTKRVRRIPNVKLSIGSLRLARAQAVLSRGDRRATPFLLDLADPRSALARLLKGPNREVFGRFGIPMRL